MHETGSSGSVRRHYGEAAVDLNSLFSERPALFAFEMVLDYGGLGYFDI
jgi:hypothetical protein